MNPKKQTFSQSAKIRLIERNMKLKDLAVAIGRPPNSVSIVINQLRPLPTVEAEVRQALGLESK